MLARRKGSASNRKSNSSNRCLGILGAPYTDRIIVVRVRKSVLKRLGDATTRQLALKRLPVVTSWVAVLAASVLGSASCHHPPIDSGFTKVTLQADWYPQPEHGGFYTALIKGYYKNEGLEVTIQPGGPFVSIEQQVSVG